MIIAVSSQRVNLLVITYATINDRHIAGCTVLISTFIKEIMESVVWSLLDLEWLCVLLHFHMKDINIFYCEHWRQRSLWIYVSHIVPDVLMDIYMSYLQFFLPLHHVSCGPVHFV